MISKSISLQVRIPAVGESVTSGMISAWLKNDGDAVNKGDALFTLDTDKVSTEVTADGPGVLRIKVAAGADVKIGDVVAVIEEGSGPSGEPLPPGGGSPAKVSTVETAVAVGVASASGVAHGPGTQGVILPATVAAEDPLTSVPEFVAPQKEGRTTRKRLSPLRRKIAAQLVMAQHTAAVLTTFNEADMSAVMALRKAMGEDFQKQHGIKLGFMSFFIKAVVAALEAVPQVNVRVEGDDLIQNHFHDIGVAVGTERGLMVPVVRDADQKSFAEIERDLAAFAAKARDGKISVEDLSGGVFTISNGGIYGSLLSTPIINPPQSGILGMHKIQERPVVVDGQIVARPMMYLALSYDHRVVDGREAVTFLSGVKENIEQPSRILLGL